MTNKNKWVKIDNINHLIYFELENGLRGLGIRRNFNKVVLVEYTFINNSCENPKIIREEHKFYLNELRKELTKRKKEILKESI